MTSKRRLLLMDANVLIDYVRTDRSVLGLVYEHVGSVHVLSTVLDEVDGLDEDGCEALGIEVVEPELAQVREAAARRGRLSVADHLCLLVARERTYACVTNDRALRRACADEGVAVVWGLELMLVLVRGGVLDAAEAVRVARAVHELNPRHITAAVVEEFIRLVTAAGEGA